MKVILFNPQIPQNTGNIIRTCAATNTELILVKPLGFSVSDRMLKRAGLDYHGFVKIQQIDNLEEYLSKTKSPFYFLSSKIKKPYTEAKFEKDSILIFGSETKGLPSEYFNKWKKNFLTIPMTDVRCLNLSTSVGIVLFEAYRQQNFIFF